MEKQPRCDWSGGIVSPASSICAPVFQSNGAAGGGGGYEFPMQRGR